MTLLQLSPQNSTTSLFPNSHHFTIKLPPSKPPNHLNFPTVKKLRALQTATDAGQSVPAPPPPEDEPPLVKFAFVHSVLLPDGTPDVHYRKARGGQKLREIMLDNNLEFLGLCSIVGEVELVLHVVEGRELLNPRTEKEKEKLKKKPKNWRLACQAIVGEPDSRGLVVIQQLPEWKAHNWNYAKELPEDVLQI
ncbi:Photosynthetic NDH subunit of subcomplex B 3, chloroplastic, variant 2 [Salvia divinorum]|uniref:Photosynthetic NDH subunit of subcomplex B 3, chloroplastic, variant 2 n=1 Tax=Salvia divinorum TaxID=28513 RepID=A0ABD1H5P1_SALDI